MAIVQTIDTAYQLEQAFKAANRENNFSYEGLRVLFDYLNELDETIELDVVALCCEYEETSTEDVIEQYDIDIPPDTDDEGIKEIVREYLEDNTSVCGETDDGFVFASF